MDDKQVPQSKELIGGALQVALPHGVKLHQPL